MHWRWLVYLGWLIVGFVSSSVQAQPLRISYSGVAGQNLAIWVTYEAGLFKKYGLNPEMLMIAGGTLTRLPIRTTTKLSFS